MTLNDLLYYTLILLILLVIFAAFWSISGYIIFRTVDNKLRRCPHCKRGSAGVIINTETEPLGAFIDRHGKKPVQVKTEKVIDHFECRRCGHTWTRSFARKQGYPLKNS